MGLEIFIVSPLTSLPFGFLSSGWDRPSKLIPSDSHSFENSIQSSGSDESKGFSGIICALVLLLSLVLPYLWIILHSGSTPLHYKVC